MTQAAAHNRILLGTDILYSLVVETDSHHQRAVRIFAQIDDGSTQVLCPYQVVIDVHQRLLRKNVKAALALTTIIKILEAFTIIYPNEADAALAATILGTSNDSKITLAETTLMAMAMNHKARLVTLDPKSSPYDPEWNVMSP